MDNTSPSNKSNTLVKVIAWGAVGYAVWSLLPPEWKGNIGRGIYQLSEEMAAAKRRKDEQQRLELIKQSTLEYFQKYKFTLDLPPLSEGLLLPPTSVKTVPLALDNQITPLQSDAKTNIDPDLIWLKRIIHPSLVLILGKRGSGKSALAYYLLELFRYGLKPYVVGIPQAKQHLLPEWIGVASSLEEVPFGAIVIVDEAYLLYHARGSTTQESKEMAKLINLSRQKGQTIIFVTQESRSIDKNIVSSANVIIFKEPGILQSEFERPELNHLAKKASEAFASINGNKQQWSYLYAPDTDFSGLISNELPSFWKPELGRMFASDISTISKPRTIGKLTMQEKMQKAKEMFEQKASYADIALVLGISKGTAFNYVHDYPYCK
jgi:Zonular occludens toxin (Zot)